MIRSSTLVLCLLGATNLACAQTIYKCAGPDGLAYRDTPCPAEQRQQSVIVAANNVSWQRDDPSRTVAQDLPSVRSGLPLSGTRLALGMTDTQVLNLSSWGRPTQIVRTKANPGWREEWLYKRFDTPRVLYFENGRLVAREDLPPPPAMEARVSIE